LPRRNEQHNDDDDDDYNNDVVGYTFVMNYIRIMVVVLRVFTRRLCRRDSRQVTRAARNNFRNSATLLRRLTKQSLAANDDVIGRTFYEYLDDDALYQLKSCKLLRSCYTCSATFIILSKNNRSLLPSLESASFVSS